MTHPLLNRIKIYLINFGNVCLFYLTLCQTNNLKTEECVKLWTQIWDGYHSELIWSQTSKFSLNRYLKPSDLEV